jgi:succinyl-diaminopimelate desuccinylase
MEPSGLLKRIDADAEQIISLCQGLIRIPSENPPGDTTKLVEYLTTIFDKKRLEYRVYAPQKQMPNFVAILRGQNKGRRIVFNGHLDTYPAGDRKQWDRDPFSGAVAEGKIFGRGVSDMIAGDTASIMTFFYLAEHKDQLKGEVVLTLVSDEETGGKWGTIWLLDNVPEVSGDAVLNGEPSGGELINFAERGHIWIRVSCKGKAAHGAYTHMGQNAIQAMNRFLNDLLSLEGLSVSPADISGLLDDGRQIVDAMKGPGATEVLKRITVNVGTISGGLKINLVPDYCEAEVDIRLPQGCSSLEIVRQIEKIQERHSGISHEVLRMIDPNYTPFQEEIVQLALKHAEAIRGHRIHLTSGIGLTDCRFFRERGIPSVVYGPRSFNMGAENEYITVQDLMDTVKVHTLTSFDYLEWLE